MKIDPKATNSDIFESFQKNHDAVSALGKWFAKLQVENDPTNLLEEKLKNLDLDDEKGKLIERGPIKDTKQPKNKPYHRVTGYNCGGTYICAPDLTQQNLNNDLLAYNYPIQNTEANHGPPKCNECYILFESNTCVLEKTNTAEFIEWFNENIEQNNSAQPQHTVQEPEVNIPHISHYSTITETNENMLNNFKTDCTFRKPHVRRISHESQDSGCYSDSPSPRSDFAPSPIPIIKQPSRTETQKKQFRKILPKTTKLQKKEEAVTSASSKSKNTQTKKNEETTAKSAQELLKFTLDQDIKQVKWIAVIAKKSSDAVFETSHGETVLHKLLRSDEKYIAESFYVVVEKMKMHPEKSLHIVAAQSSICDAIIENKRPKLWLDYFCEAVQIIQHKLESSKAKN